jgi:hypothetical protein
MRGVVRSALGSMASRGPMVENRDTSLSLAREVERESRFLGCVSAGWRSESEKESKHIGNVGIDIMDSFEK